MKLDLFEKTELCVRPLDLRGANLSAAARACAGVLELEERYVQVIDARDDLLCLDITAPELRPEQFFGREEALLQALAGVEGIGLLPGACVHTAGILGAMALPQMQGDQAVRRAERLAQGVGEAIARRALILPSGAELEQAPIQDTNSPYLKELLEQEGFRTCVGPIVPDRLEEAVFRFRQGVEEGYGLILSTGGVGAEAKDVNVEAMERVAQRAYTPEILRFTQGQGRHAKAAVRIGVGVCGYCTMIDLPGPHAEVEAAAPALRRFLRGETGPKELAEELALALRERWRTLAAHHCHGDA